MSFLWDWGWFFTPPIDIPIFYLNWWKFTPEPVDGLQPGAVFSLVRDFLFWPGFDVEATYLLVGVSFFF